MNILKAVGKVVKGAVELKANVLTGGLSGAVKAAAEFLADSVKLGDDALAADRDQLREGMLERPDVQIQLSKQGQKGMFNHSLVDFRQEAILCGFLPESGDLDVNMTVWEPGAGPLYVDGGVGWPAEQDGTADTSEKKSAADVVGDLAAGTPEPTDGAGLLDMMEQRPEAFQDMWDDMSESDRQLAMMNLQRQLQAVQQLTTMMSNMLDSQHGAAMSVARNLSV